jgi:cell division protein FtsB
MVRTFSLEIGAIAAVAAFLIGTTATATWYIRSDRLEQLNHELEAIKGAKDWRLPETINSLRDLSEKVKIDVGERKELEMLRTERGQLTEKNTKLEADWKTAQANIGELENMARQCFLPSANFELAEGQARQLVKNGLAVGLKSIINDRVQVNLDREEAYISIGERKEVKNASGPCWLTLMSLHKTTSFGSPDRATFSFACPDALSETSLPKAPRRHDIR